MLTLHCPLPAPSFNTIQLDVREEIILGNINKTYPYEDIMEWRKLVNSAIKVEQDKSQSAGGWFSGLFKGGAKVYKLHFASFALLHHPLRSSLLLSPVNSLRLKKSQRRN